MSIGIMRPTDCQYDKKIDIDRSSSLSQLFVPECFRILAASPRSSMLVRAEREHRVPLPSFFSGWAISDGRRLASNWAASTAGDSLMEIGHQQLIDL